MIEVFKTNITAQATATEVIKELRRTVPVARVNFDLDDCDKILRIEGPHVPVADVVDLLTAMGHYCEVLK